MTATKKAAPVLEHRDGQRVEKKACKPSPLPFYQIEGSLAMSISDYLGHGAENAISAATLAALTLTTPRELRRLIMDERKGGALILYQPGGRGSGYFLPSLDEEQARREVSEFYNTQAARCRNGFAAIAPARRFLKIPAGQLKINTAKGKRERIVDLIQRMDMGETPEECRYNGIDFVPADYPAMIATHFRTRYRNCDYNICHFFSGSIRYLRFCESVLTDGV
uniref:hypothetical protein n=1 Tax=Gemmiger formicilis TaxID=745368 RepID=UPI003FEF0A49